MRKFGERGVKFVGLPVASDEPDYLHVIAHAAGLRVNDERVLFSSGEAR